MKKKLKKIFKNGLFIFFFPLVGSMEAYFLELGFLKHYNLGKEFISISNTDLIYIGFIGLIIALPISVFLHNFEVKEKDKYWSFFGSFFIFGLSIVLPLCVMIYLFSPAITGGIVFLFLLILGFAFTALVSLVSTIPMYNINKKSNENKITTNISNEENKKYKKKSAKTPNLMQLCIIFTFFAIIFLTYLVSFIGIKLAEEKSEYYIIVKNEDIAETQEDNKKDNKEDIEDLVIKEFIIITEYKDGYLTLPIDKVFDENKFAPEFEYIKYDDIFQIYPETIGKIVIEK